MLFVFYGNDVVAVRNRVHDFLGKYEKDGYVVERANSENYYEGIYVDFAGSAPLFSEKQVVVIDTPSEKKEAFESFLSDAELLSESPNTFVLIEGALNASEKKVLKKHAKEFHEEKVSGEECFNLFSITDAFLRRDKKSLWILLNRAWEQGHSGEEIIGTLSWQVKILRLAEGTSSAEEAGQKPFVYSKAKRALSIFKEGELTKMSRDLLSVYHEAHLGKRDMDIALERWVLRL